jgi:signal transduction histidine kinase
VLSTDARKLRQILLNLLGNAVKFTEHGGVTLAVERRGDMLAFTIADTGAGIPAADQERVFEPFTQGDASTTRTHGGTGLGLAITRRLVELLDGSASLESSASEGAVFTVELPLTPEAAR